jgi:hypothetical protein
VYDRLLACRNGPRLSVFTELPCIQGQANGLSLRRGRLPIASPKKVLEMRFVASFEKVLERVCEK